MKDSWTGFRPPLTNRNWRLERGLLKTVIRNKDRCVFKRVDEDGGSGVWIGCKRTRRQMSRLVEDIRRAPERYIVQEYEHLSILKDQIVDLRLHAHVDADNILVSNSPWGRANWVRGDGKVNLGSKGFTSPVIVTREAYPEKAGQRAFSASLMR